jgi:CRP-like cAMP-binding protein
MSYRKGDQMEREGDPSRWFGFVAEGCFKYVTHEISSDREHITWFSFEGEYMGDYPSCLNGSPAQTTIEAMLPSRVLRVTGQQLEQFFDQSMETMELRAIVANHFISQYHSLIIALHCATPRERYEMLLKRCPGIVQHLPLNAISSFLCITPQMLSKIRKGITFEARQ